METPRITRVQTARNSVGLLYTFFCYPRKDGTAVQPNLARLMFFGKPAMKRERYLNLYNPPTSFTKGILKKKQEPECLHRLAVFLP